MEAVHARLLSAGVNPSADLANHVDNLMGVLIVQGQARYRLDPVLPDQGSTERLCLDTPTRRMAELTREHADASIFNIWHEALSPSPLDRYLLPLLDGTRDRNALIDALTAIAHERPHLVEHDGYPVSDDAALREILAEQVDSLPRRLTEMKLLRLG